MRILGTYFHLQDHSTEVLHLIYLTLIHTNLRNDVPFFVEYIVPAERSSVLIHSSLHSYSSQFQSRSLHFNPLHNTNYSPKWGAQLLPQVLPLVTRAPPCGGTHLTKEMP